LHETTNNIVNPSNIFNTERKIKVIGLFLISMDIYAGYFYLAAFMIHTYLIPKPVIRNVIASKVARQSRRRLGDSSICSEQAPQSCLLK